MDRIRRLSSVVAAMAAVTTFATSATLPVLPSANRQVTLDGIPLGSAIANRSSYPTLLHDGGTATYHMWVGVTDETGSTGPDYYPLRIAGFRHATSSDGIAFTTTGTLSFAGNPFATTIFGSAYGEPPWIYPKAALWNGRTTLLLWTINGFFGPPSLGDYNYNISVNDVGPAPGNLAVGHFGPLGAVPSNGIFGQSAGAFGIVNGVLYYDNNSLLGRTPLADNGPQTYPASANTGPWRAAGTNTPVADPLPALGYIACHLPGGNTYLHNDARVIANGDGTLGFLFTLRNCDGSRKAQQIWYMESADDGVTWSSPAGIVSGAVTIDGQAPAGGFALADVVVANGQRIVYFNFPVNGGALIVGALPAAPLPPAGNVPVPVDARWMLAALLGALAIVAVAALRRRT